MSSDLQLMTIKSEGDIDKYKNNEVELFAREVVRIENDECVYIDLKVDALFNEEALGDPNIFNNESLETSPLGSLSNYRQKIMVRNDLESKLILIQNHYNLRMHLLRILLPSTNSTHFVMDQLLKGSRNMSMDVIS